MLPTRRSFEGPRGPPSSSINARPTQRRYRIATPQTGSSLSSRPTANSLVMNSSSRQYFDGRQNRGRTPQNPARVRGHQDGDGRQSRNSSYNIASTSDKNQREPNIRHLYNSAHPPPRASYTSAQALPQTLQATLIAPWDLDSTKPTIPSQPQWSLIPDWPRAHRSLPLDRGYMSPTREVYPSLSQESPSLATGFPRNQQGTESQPSAGDLQQGPNSVHPPDALEIPDEEYETRRMPSHTQPSQVEVTPGADGKPQGLVRFIRGQMQYREVNEYIWKVAVYHDELRDALIAEASLLGEYDHARERGMADNDVTSYLPSQKEWGPDREADWPKIENNVLHRFERKGYPIPEYRPEVWYDGRGRIVLDPDNHPILKYKVLPATLSSELSGRDMEAMKRLDLRLSRKDFRARMPRTIIKKDKGRNRVEKPIYTLSAIGMRTTRFRKEKGLVSWTKREGSDSIRSYMLERMPQANILANSTQGMPAPTFFEQKDSRTSNRGKHLARAGRRALPDETRREKAQRENERLQRLHEDHLETIKKTGGLKRKREEGGLEDEKDMETAKRMREDIALPASESTSALSLPKFDLNFSPVPQTIGLKHSREEASTDDEKDLEGPLKRHKAQTIPGQPMPRSISRPKAPARSFHRGVGRSIGHMASGNGFATKASAIPCASSTGHTIPAEPQQIQHHQVEENRFDDSAAFVVEAPDSTVQSTEFYFKDSLRGYVADQRGVDAELAPRQAENAEMPIAEDSNFSDPAPPTTEDHSQEIDDRAQFDQTRSEISSSSVAWDDAGFSRYLISSAAEWSQLITTLPETEGTSEIEGGSYASFIDIDDEREKYASEL